MYLLVPGLFAGRGKMHIKDLNCVFNNYVHYSQVVP